MARVSQSSAGRSQVNVSGPVDVEAVGFDTLTNPPGQVAVALTTTLLLAANPNRKYAHISNNSGNPVFIQFDTAAVLNQGIRIPAFGLYTIESNNLWLGSINAISVVAGTLIDILEGE